MKILGIEIKGNDCIFMALEGDKTTFTLADFPKKTSLTDSYDSLLVRQFHAELSELLCSHQVDGIVIKKRTEKGKFAGGAISFKMEGIIQLAFEKKVSFISGPQIKALIKSSPEITLPAINKYQEQAFYAAYTFLESK